MPSGPTGRRLSRAGRGLGPAGGHCPGGQTERQLRASLYPRHHLPHTRRPSRPDWRSLPVATRPRAASGCTRCSGRVATGRLAQPSLTCIDSPRLLSCLRPRPGRRGRGRRVAARPDLPHLRRRDQRLRALREAWRVVRPGGPVFVAAISPWAPRLDGEPRARLCESLPAIRELTPRSSTRGGCHRWFRARSRPTATVPSSPEPSCAAPGARAARDRTTPACDSGPSGALIPYVGSGPSAARRRVPPRIYLPGERWRPRPPVSDVTGSESVSSLPCATARTQPARGGPRWMPPATRERPQPPSGQPHPRPKRRHQRPPRPGHPFGPEVAAILATAHWSLLASRSLI